jgi:rubrerythrin
MAFTIQEIIDIAIGIEETGYEFYTQCGSKFNNPAMSLEKIRLI